MKQKIVWRSIGIPKALFDKLKVLIVQTGHVSVSEYVREAIAFRMKWHLDRIEEAFEE